MSTKKFYPKKKDGSRIVCYTYTRTPYHVKFTRRKNKRYGLRYAHALRKNKNEF